MAASMLSSLVNMATDAVTIAGYFDNVDHLRGANSTVDLTYTYSNSRYLCVRGFYFAHLYAVYVILFSGIMCMASIAFQSTTWMHIWWGRLYVYAMMIATISALLIFNSGLPEAVLWGFAYVLNGMIVGWIVVKFHQAKLHSAAVALVESRMSKESQGEVAFKLQEAIKQAKVDIVNAKTAGQRFFSYKAFHGVSMFFSWWSLAGRYFFSNQSGDFTCYTYPILKPVNASQYKTYNLADMPYQFVPLEDPDYGKTPWGKMGEGAWATLMFVVPVCIALLVGSFISHRAAPRTQDVEM